jgi:DNA-directed RNA polymerase specialized sigma subunit
MAESQLEPDLQDAYGAWAKTPSPESNAAMLHALSPTIDSAVKSHVGQGNPLIHSKARRLTLDSLRTYDPAKGKLKTHVHNYLRGLTRINAQQGQILSVPRRVLLEKYQLEQAEQELGHELGREPTDEELFDHTGLSARRVKRIRLLHPAVAEGTLEDTEHGVMGAVDPVGRRAGETWRQLVYDDLDPLHQKVMEHALGMNGRPVLSNNDIARRLRRSPAAISQAKAHIQKLLDEEQELSPF